MNSAILINWMSLFKIWGVYEHFGILNLSARYLDTYLS